MAGMNYATLDIATYALRLDPGDDIHESIQKFCDEQSIENAAVQGLGSVESPTLAHYSMKTKQFTDRSLSGIYEVTSLLGNVALVDGKPFAHLHVTVSNEKMETFGGHLVKGECSATLELVVQSFTSKYAKVHNDAIGLKVWEFEKS
jgi:predicted DNA-binding protein with PD1-like motif